MIEVAAVEPGWAVVTFRLSLDLGERRIAVLGDFNDWDRETSPMTVGPDRLSTSLRLATGRFYRFRYLIDGDRWENDWEADAYVDNEFGGSDSVIDLRHDGPRRHQLKTFDPSPSESATRSLERRRAGRTRRVRHSDHTLVASGGASVDEGGSPPVADPHAC